MKNKIVQVRDTCGLFVKVDDVAVIIVSKSGIQKQVDIYSRKNVLYASVGSGFVALSSSIGSRNGTSSTSYKWIEIVPLDNNGFEYLEPRVGYLELVNHD